MRPGMSLAEREWERQRHRDRAIEQANRMMRSLVCGGGSHARCRGEEPHGFGCLCECHDGVTAS